MEEPHTNIGCPGMHSGTDLPERQRDVWYEVRMILHTQVAAVGGKFILLEYDFVTILLQSCWCIWSLGE